MKFIYACDIHGDSYKYEKLLEEAENNRVNNIVLGGDLLPKFCQNREECQTEYIKGFLDNYFDKLEQKKINCICVLGNDDLKSLDDIFEEVCNKHKNVYNIDKKKATVDGIEFIGLSNVLDHPFGCKDRVVIENGLEMQTQLSSTILVEKCSKKITIPDWYQYRKNIKSMEEVLLELPKHSADQKCIYVFHNPPYGLGLDVCHDGRQVGSKAILKFIEESNAYMSLHGHIHESPSISGVWKNYLNNTICIQPGQTQFGNKNMYYVLIDTDTNNIERISL